MWTNYRRPIHFQESPDFQGYNRVFVGYYQTWKMYSFLNVPVVRTCCIAKNFWLFAKFCILCIQKRYIDTLLYSFRDEFTSFSFRGRLHTLMKIPLQAANEIFNCLLTDYMESALTKIKRNSEVTSMKFKGYTYENI